jgi:hypothetical protein
MLCFFSEISSFESEDDMKPSTAVHKPADRGTAHCPASCGADVGRPADTIQQCCPTFLYIRAHLTDGCGGAQAMWRL